MHQPTRHRRPTAFLVTLCSLALLSLWLAGPAFAQATPPVVPSTVSVSSWTMVIALLGVLTGYVVNAKNSGSLFGVVTVPSTWLPYLSLFGTALAAFVQSISSAPVVDGATLFTAALAALVALGGVTAGVTVHQHLSVAKAPTVTPPSKVVSINDAPTPLPKMTKAPPPPAVARTAYRSSMRPVAPELPWWRRAASVDIPAVVATSVVASLLLVSTIGALVSGCTNGVLNPQVVNVSVLSLETLACGLSTYAKDTSTAPINWGQVALDLAGNCGLDVADIVNAFGATSPVAQAAQANASGVHAASIAAKARLSAGTH